MSVKNGKNSIESDAGEIFWQRGTGGNVEITYFKSSQPQIGYGRRLLREMLMELRKNPPYHTVYGFTRTSNLNARAAYVSLGFTLSPVLGVYKDGDAMVFSAPYEDLCKKHLTEDGASDDRRASR